MEGGRRFQARFFGGVIEVWHREPSLERWDDVKALEVGHGLLGM